MRCQEITGQREMDATAILDYFAPLQKWLDEQNKGKPSAGKLCCNDYGCSYG